MRITFLGTGTSQGVPVIACTCPTCKSEDVKDRRLRSSVLIEHQGTTITIDAGPDFRQQMLRANVSKLDAIIITHEHRDHVAGLDDVRAFNWVLKRPMDIWAEPRVMLDIKEEFGYAFAETKYPGAPEMTLHPIVNKPFNAMGVDIIPIRILHGKLPIFGFRIGDFSYLTDISEISDTEKAKLAGSKVLVVSAIRMTPHTTHFSLPQALELIAEINPQQAYITHISHQLPPQAEVQKTLPKNVRLAFDGLTLDI